MNEIEKAKAILREAGYFTDNLWTIRDIQDRFKCDDDTAQEILNDAFTSVDGTIRQLTLRERLQQIINLGQPSEIKGVRYTEFAAEIALERFKSSLLDEEIGRY